jgi:defect-in-organelle-trafficking protein DotC
MSHIIKKQINVSLVIFIALALQGCGSLKSTCATPCKSKDKKISSNPTPIKPYAVVGSAKPQPSISTVKEQLKSATGVKDGEAAIGALRAQALRETALSLGARGGLAERALQINGTLLNYEPVLDRVFQFNGMLLDDNILSPVLVEARNTLNLSGGDSIRAADRTYKILNQAKFVSAAPTWREYLLMSYDVPTLPDRSLLPRNKPERIMWENDLEEGWNAGLQQAELIFMENINRLVRDYSGMILYRNLLAQKIVSEPFVATMNMGVTGGGEDLTVNDRLLRITAFPQLQADSSSWKTELHIHE